MRVESSKQIRSQTCCSVTIDSKNHLVSPAVSADDYPVIQEDAHRRLIKEEQQALDLATEEERETARTIVSRLHVGLGHSDPRGMIESLRRKHAHRLIIAAAKKVQLQCLRKKVRDEGYVQWLLEFFMNLARVFKLTNSSGSIQCVTYTCWEP